jgi:alkyl hydroperoxide reductase subunit AhpF
MYRLLRSTRLLKISLASLSAASIYYYTDNMLRLGSISIQTEGKQGEASYLGKLPSRAEMLQKLQGTTINGEKTEDSEYDLLVIGGGATGVGCAVDAASRGLKVALVERDDFSCGINFIYYLNEY